MATPNGIPDSAELPAPCRRLFLFDHCRTTSNLFLKVLGDDPNVSKITYPFYHAYTYGPESIVGGTTCGPNTSNDPKDTYQEAFDRMTASIASTEKEGKTPFVKEHLYFFLDPRVTAAGMPRSRNRSDGKPIYLPTIIDKDDSTVPSQTNPTLLPNQFLHSVSPIFLFRHPARFIRSYYRACAAAYVGNNVRDLHRDEFSITTSLRWLRLLHDWYINVYTTIDKKNSRNSPWPIVIESDDFLHEPQILQKLCAAAGFDPKYVRNKWDVTPVAERKQGRITEVFLGALYDSSGIKMLETRDCEINLEEERRKFVEEFGEDVGGTLADYMDQAMGDYWYLRRFRLQ